MLEQHHPDVYPHFPIPDGYTLSTYRDGFDLAWAKLVYATGMASSVERALKSSRTNSGQSRRKYAPTACLCSMRKAYPSRQRHCGTAYG